MSQAFGGEPDSWSFGNLIVGDGLVIAIAQEREVITEAMKNGDEAAAKAANRWFIASLG